MSKIGYFIVSGWGSQNVTSDPLESPYDDQYTDSTADDAGLTDASNLVKPRSSSNTNFPFEIPKGNAESTYIRLPISHEMSLSDHSSEGSKTHIEGKLLDERIGAHVSSFGQNIKESPTESDSTKSRVNSNQLKRVKSVKVPDPVDYPEPSSEEDDEFVLADSQNEHDSPKSWNKIRYEYGRNNSY
jgi:hypothetical protein